MRFLTVISVFLWVGLALAQVPTVLIVQPKQVTEKGEDFSAPVADYIAAEAEQEGRVQPIVWSLTDPLFRKAAEEGLVSGNATPTLDLAQRAARAMKAEFVLWLDIKFRPDGIGGRARLFRGGRAIWTKDEASRIEAGGSFSADSSARSVARSLYLLMVQDPLKAFPPRPKQATPEATRPTTNAITEAPPLQPAVIDNAELRQQIDAALAAKQPTVALQTAYDGVDLAPLNPKRRIWLVELLRSQGNHLAAAESADRAANLFLDQPVFRLMAGEAWLAAGRLDSAQVAFNEALARNPDDLTIRREVGRIFLIRLEPAKAVEHLDLSLKGEPTASALGMRALARALMGGSEGVKLDLDRMRALSAEPDPVFYRFGMDILDRDHVATAERLRQLVQNLTLKPKAPALSEELELETRRAVATRQLLSGLIVPPSAEASHRRRLLACNLRVQSLTDLAAYIKAPTAEALTDVRLNLGEAIRQWNAAKEAMGSEPKDLHARPASPLP